MVHGSLVSIDDLRVWGKEAPELGPEEEEVGATENDGGVEPQVLTGRDLSQIGEDRRIRKLKPLGEVHEFREGEGVHDSLGVQGGDEALEFLLSQGERGSGH